MDVDTSSAVGSKRSYRGFRFTAEQRAFLEAEAESNPSTPDLCRREELARQIGVQEISIKVRIVQLFRF